MISAPESLLHHRLLPHSRARPDCLSELSTDPDGLFRHLSIFNQPPTLTRQLLPNWFETYYHQHRNADVGQQWVLIKTPPAWKIKYHLLQPVCVERTANDLPMKECIMWPNFSQVWLLLTVFVELVISSLSKLPQNPEQQHINTISSNCC